MCLILYRFTQFPLESAEIDSFAILDLDNTPEREALCLACSSADKRLLCLKIMLGDACATGEKLTWSRDMGSRAWNLATSEVPVPGSPGRVLVHAGREDGNFHAYDADGVPAWSHKFMATISEFCSYNDPVTRQSLVLVPSLDKTLRLLDASNGHLVWGDTFQSGVNVARVLGGLHDGRHVLVAGGNDHTLRCYARDACTTGPKDYKMAWFHKFGSYVRDVGVSSSGIVAGVADDGFLKVLDLATGQVRWTHEHNSFAWKCKVLDSLGTVVSTSYQVPLAVDETGEQLGNPGVIACHSLEGDLVWQTDPGDGMNVNCWDFCNLDGQALVVAGTTSGTVAILDVESGRFLQRHECGHLVNKVAFVPARAVEAGGNKLPCIVACCEWTGGSLLVGSGKRD